MFAVTVSEAGHLGWGEAPDPIPQPGEVVIDVAAAGVNRADLLQARGRYDPPPGASEVLGLECSGTVVAVADPAVDGDPRFTVGDRVCALLAGGGYATRVAVPAAQVLPVPRGVSLVDAAGLPEVCCTVWSNLVMTAGLAAGRFVLVHGGASGIGTMAIQVARALGARVAATASSAEKLALVTSLGAEIAIDYRHDDFARRVTEATAGRGADIILDVVGAAYLDRNIAALADGGRIVVIGLMGGARAEIDLAALMGKRAGVIGTQLRTRPVRGAGSKAEVVAAVRRHLWPLLESGEIRPVIGATVSMTEASTAHGLVADGAVTGKVVITRPS